MTRSETVEFVLKPHSRHARPLSVRFTRGDSVTDLTIAAEGEQLFSGRVLSSFAGVLEGVFEMEEAAVAAKGSNIMKYYGCMYIARHGRSQVATRLDIPELAQYD
jgi:hypothetical protein